MTMRYARSDVESFHCGDHHHFRNDMSKPFGVDCPDCDEAMLRCGWANSPETVEKTPDEKREMEKAKEQGDVLTRAMAESWAKEMASTMGSRQNAI